MSEIALQAQIVPAFAKDGVRWRAASMSANTKRVIEKGWSAFENWCRWRGLCNLPADPETLEAYLIFLAESGKKVATIEAARYAIDARHIMAGRQEPGHSHIVKVAMAGIRRTLGVKQRQAAALTIEHIRSITFPNTLKGLRDRALLMVAVCGGLRRSELKGLTLGSVLEAKHGLRLFLPRSKGDQEGAGAYVEIVRAAKPEEGCPVEAIQAWLLAYRHPAEAPLFPGFRKCGRLRTRSLSGHSIALVFKAAAEQAGFDPGEFSGHSGRVGCATYLLEHGVPINAVAAHLRHKSINTTLTYDRTATARALKGIY